MRVGLLMEFDHEQGIEYLRALLNNSLSIAAVIFVGHRSSAHAEALLLERTGGLYQKPSLSSILSGTAIPTFFIDDINGPDCSSTISELNLDLLVCQSSRIIRVPIFDLPKQGVLNCHTAILPYLRGSSCLEWSIYNDQPIGVTCHHMVRKVDAGPVVSQSLLKYHVGDTYEVIRTKIIYLMAQMMCDSALKIVSSSLTKSVQMDSNGPWFSPMRDPDTIQVVKDKLLKNTYLPAPFPNNDMLSNIDIDIIERAWSK